MLILSTDIRFHDGVCFWDPLSYKKAWTITVTDNVIFHYNFKMNLLKLLNWFFFRLAGKQLFFYLFGEMSVNENILSIFRWKPFYFYLKIYHSFSYLCVDLLDSYILFLFRGHDTPTPPLPKKVREQQKVRAVFHLKWNSSSGREKTLSWHTNNRILWRDR